MITIYDKNNVVRVKLNVNDGSAVQAVYSEEDAVLNQEISNEEFVSIRITSVTFIAFQVGDYLEAYGNTYRLKKIPAPIDKNGSNRFEYTLKFESNRADLAEVNLQLFDNTTVEVVPAYNPATTYSSGDVVSYHTLHWQYINPTPSNGNVPSENDYWALKSTVTNYVPAYAGTTTYTYGDIVDYNNNYYMHIGATDTIGVKPIEGEHWTVVKTAPQWDFSTILTPTRYAQLIVDNMNRARPNQTWTVGYCIPAEPKETTFSNVKCLDACASIAELFETEFWIDGYSLNFGKRANTTAITMGYGKGNGFKKITRNEVTESRKVTRLIALGGERNLPGTYRNGSKRLMLPDKYYLDAANIDLTSPLEDTQMWDDIIPTMQHATEDYNNATTYYAGDQVLYGGYSWDCITQCTGVTPSEGTYWKYSEGTVTTYVGQYKFIDKNITFDPLGLDVRMKDGTIPKVKFLTGNLAGYEFPITGYNNTTKQITIEQISDSTDSLLPTPSYGFKVGDRFCFVDLYMPSTYIPKAQMRLLAKAQDYLNKYSVDQVSYAGEVDEIWAKNNTIELRIGDIIHFNDTDFGISLDYRIVKLTRNLTRPYKYTIELSTLPYIPSKITTITNKINQNETYIQYNGLNTKMSKSKTFLGAREAIDMAFDPSGFYFTDKIRPLIVETSALLVGTEQQQYQITDLDFRTHSSNSNLIEWGIGTIIDSSIGETARTWNIASGSFTATDNSQAYYCYIRCERAVGSTSAIVLFDTVPHLTEEGNDYYFFLLGTLSSVKNGMRQLYTSKGFTFINADSIVTGTIQSESGETYLDLKNGITHIGSTEKYIDYRNGEFKVKGNLVVSPSGIEFPMPCFRGEYNITYFYYKGDTVLYNGSTWIYVNTNPTLGLAPVEGAYWNLYSKKGDAGVTGNYFENRYAVNGSNSTPPSIVVTDIVPYGWSTTLPIQGLMEYTWVTTAEKTSSGALVTNWSTPQRITGIQGATGANGPAQSYWGIWDSSKSYVGTDIIVNVVKYNSAYYISRIDAGIIPAGTLPTNTNYWNVYGSTFEAIATGLLLAENAWIGNLIVSRLGTSANPYAARFANVGTGIGIFKNLDDENDIDNAIIGMGKDISIMQQAGERKPAFVVRDKQWRGTYSSTRIYYKDDRVYYNGSTYIFTKDWLETDTPSAGYLPTNFSYWQFLGSGNLGGGKYSELGSEGIFSNGSNIRGLSGALEISSNFSAVYLLQKRNSQANGLSAAVLGIDYTDETYGQSKSYGGYFNSAYIGRVVNNVRNVSVSGAILKSDYRIHCYGSSAITLSLPTPDNSMVGQTIVIRKIGSAEVTITTSSSYPIWHTSEITSITSVENDSLSFTWDGNYWVTYFTNQY